MFTLLARKNQDPKFQELLDKVLPGHKCDSCEAKELCPLPDIKVVAEEWISAKKADFNEINKIIKEELETTDFIIVMDGEKDICYIFKAEGTIPEIKKATLREAMIMYEKTQKTHVFFSEIRDMRDVPIVVDDKPVPAEEETPAKD